MVYLLLIRSTVHDIVPPITVLIVDDDADDRFFMEQAFKSDSPTTQVQLAHDGQQALDMLATKSTLPDVILLDLNMPRLDGFEVLKCLKRSAEHRSIPVVVLTTSSATADQQLAQQLGAEAFITKPTSVAGLSAVAGRIRQQWTRDRATSSDRSTSPRP